MMFKWVKKLLWRRTQKDIKRIANGSTERGSVSLESQTEHSAKSRVVVNPGAVVPGIDWRTTN